MHSAAALQSPQRVHLACTLPVQQEHKTAVRKALAEIRARILTQNLSPNKEPEPTALPCT